MAVVFSDGFESGDFSAWTIVTGSPQVNTDAALIGTYGTECEPGEFVRVSFSNLSSAHARIYIDPNSASLSTQIDIAGLYNTGAIVCLDYSGGYRLRICMIQGDNSRVYSDWHNIDDGVHFVEIASDLSGKQTAWWIDGVAQDTVTVPNVVYLGVAWLRCGWIAGSGSGTIYVDAAVVDDSDYIGGSGVEFYPSASAAIAATTGPTVLFGSATLEPNPVSGLATGVDPAVILGSTTLGSDPASAIAAGVDPTVLFGSAALSPDPVSAIATTTHPRSFVDVGEGRQVARYGLAQLLREALVSTYAQAVYHYLLADFGGRSPVVVVASEGTQRQQYTAQGTRPTYHYTVHTFTRYAVSGTSWDEEDAELRMDILEREIGAVLEANKGRTVYWKSIDYGEMSTCGSVTVGGFEYRHEHLPVTVESY